MSIVIAKIVFYTIAVFTCTEDMPTFFEDPRMYGPLHGTFVLLCFEFTVTIINGGFILLLIGLF